MQEIVRYDAMQKIVRYESGGRMVEFSADDIRTRLCPNIDDRELALVMALCQAQKLDPFTRDVYIVKYGNNPAKIITSKEVFTKRAQANPKFQGFQAGLTFLAGDQIVQREGSMPVAGWNLIGGWCKVYVEGYRVPVYDEVALSEYDTGNSNWKRMPGTMIRKVALCHALREAFPSDFQGLYGAEEMGEIGENIAEVEHSASEAVYVAQEYIEPERTEEELAAIHEEVDNLLSKFAIVKNKTKEEVISATIETKTVQSFGEISSLEEATYEHFEAMKALLSSWMEKLIDEEAKDD